MRRVIVLLGTAAALAGCGQSSNGTAENRAATNEAAVEKPRPTYCFFKDSATKAWKAVVDKSGNVVVTGKGYAEDARYKAVLSPATVSGTTAEIAPTLAQNDTGFASPDNWWDMTQTIPNSRAVASVTVKCGEETVASLTVPRKK
jgi:hypothetical protein